MSSDGAGYVLPIWQRSNPELTDGHVKAALASIGVGVASIERDKRLVSVDKGNERTAEIQDVLKKWSTAKGELNRN